MIGFMTFVAATADCFPVHCNNRTFLAVAGKQSYRYSESASGFNCSKTPRNVSLSGISFGSSRNWLNTSYLCIPNSSISAKSSPSQIRVHSPIMMISSSLWRIFSRSVPPGIFHFHQSRFQFFYFHSYILTYCRSFLNAVALTSDTYFWNETRIEVCRFERFTGCFLYHFI